MNLPTYHHALNFTRTDLDGESRLRIVGALDARTVVEISPMIEGVVAHHSPQVTIDFDELTLIDSTGVGAIVSLFKRVTAENGKVTVVRAHDQPLAVLKLLKLDRVLGL